MRAFRLAQMRRGPQRPTLSSRERRAGGLHPQPAARSRARKRDRKSMGTRAFDNSGASGVMEGPSNERHIPAATLCERMDLAGTTSFPRNGKTSCATPPGSVSHSKRCVWRGSEHSTRRCQVGGRHNVGFHPTLARPLISAQASAAARCDYSCEKHTRKSSLITARE